MIDTLTYTKLKNLLAEVTISYLEYVNACVESKSTYQTIEAAYSRAYAAKLDMLSYIDGLVEVGNE